MVASIFMNQPFLRGGSGSSPAPIPANYEMIGFGDSRTENGFAISNTTSGLSQITSTISHMVWLEILSGLKLRISTSPNFAISASNTYQGSALPRQNSSGVVTTGDYWRSNHAVNFSGNKGAEYFETHPAGIGVFLYGTNDTAVSDPQYLTTSRTNVTTMLDRAPSKVWIILNELPKGIQDNGTVGTGSVSANFKSFSDWLLTLDYASGHANARANCIVVDTFAALVDPATGTNYSNLRGTSWDGLHYAPGGAKLAAQTVINRLSAIWPSWGTLPVLATFPTTNGLISLGAAQPFIMSNPIFTPGTNGTVSGTWGSAPSAANVPQGWVVTVLSNGSGITCVADKTETDDEGYPVLKLTLSGTLGANLSSQVQVYQLLGGASLTSAWTNNWLTISDKLRGVGKCKVDAGAQYLSGVGLALIMQSPTVNKYQTSAAARGPTVINATAPAFIDAYADSAWRPYQTQLMDFQDPGKVALGQNITAQSDISQIQLRWEIDFRNLTASTQNISAVIRFSRSGAIRV